MPCVPNMFSRWFLNLSSVNYSFNSQYSQNSSKLFIYLFIYLFFTIAVELFCFHCVFSTTFSVQVHFIPLLASGQSEPYIFCVYYLCFQIKLNTACSFRVKSNIYICSMHISERGRAREIYCYSLGFTSYIYSKTSKSEKS